VKTRIAFVLGAGLGYVFGTRAGRQKYEELAQKVEGLWQHPKVQQQVAGAEDALHTVVTEQVPKLTRKATLAARHALGLELPEE